MPSFDLARSVPGLHVVAPDPLVLTSAPTAVSLRFTDGALWMPEGQTVTVSGSYDTARGVVELSAGSFTPPPSLLGGQLRLQRIAITVAVADGPGGTKFFDTSAANPVVATGEVRWQGETTEVLGVAGGGIDLAVSYLAGANGGGLELSLAAPVSVPRVAVTLESGRLRVDALPAEAAAVVTLAGDAALQAGGTFLASIEQTLQRVFGAANIPSLDPPPFLLRRKFRRSAAGLPDIPLEPPSLSLLPDWSGGSAPAVDLAPGVAVTIGRPRFTFRLPDANLALPPIELSLRDSRLRFPDVPALQTVDLFGNLDFRSDAGSAWHFAFEPAMGGVVALPDVLRFFLAQLRWLEGQLPDLDAVPDLLVTSLGDMDWYRLFEGLLGTLDLGQFATAFRGVLDGAAATPGAPPADQLFRLAFGALQPEGDRLFPVIWQVWFERLPVAWDTLAHLLQAMVGDLTGSAYRLLLETLLAAGALDLGALLRAILQRGADQVDGALEVFLRFWLQVLAVAVRSLPPGDIAAALFAILRQPAGKLGEFRMLSSLPALSLGSPFASSAFNLRIDATLVGLGLQGLLVLNSLPDDLLSFPDTERLLDHLFGPLSGLWATLFGEWPRIDATQVLGLFVAFFSNAEGDEASEIVLLQMGRIFPVGVFMAVAGAAWNALRPGHIAPWARLMYRSIEDEAALAVRRLDPPGAAGRKYLIFSDIHRDTAADQRGPFQFGSMDHFSVHRQLYLDVLTHAHDQGYTVIEAGDGEELWFIRDFEQHQGAAHLLQQVLATHAAIYDKLAELYEDGRYVRLIGNHDSHLRTPSVFQHLAARFPNPDPQGRAFQLYDFVIVPDVKTLDDGAVDLAIDLANAPSNAARVDMLKERLVLDRIGLDSEPYRATKPLIVTHGHQWDFWNCDANNLVGKLFANSVGVPADLMNDPFNDLGGLNSGGSILVDFQEALAGVFVFSNFPAHLPARRFAHDIQHMPDKNRRPIDDIMYLETVTALVGQFAMPLSIVDDQGNLRTWANYLSNPGARPLDVFKHLFNQLSVGHTHYPQAQPYYDIEGLLFGPLADVADFVRAELREHLFGVEPSLNVMRSRYFNSGTAGWMEGVIWAIEINEHGEARLVYWTEDTRLDRPQTMDWQLPRMSDAMRQALDARKAAAEAWLRELPELVGNSLVEVLTKLGAVLALPAEVILAFADELAGGDLEMDVADVDLSGIGAVAADLTAHVTAEWNRIREFVIRWLVAHYRRLTTPGAGPQTFTLGVALPDEVRIALERVQGVLAQVPFPGIDPGVVQSKIVELCCVWILATHAAGVLNKDRSERSLFRTGAPVAWLVIALVAILPGALDNSLPFRSAVTLNGNRLEVRLILG
jgi:hypothetical protein